MDKKNTSNKVPIYKLTSKKEVLKYYKKWAEKNQYNKDMVEWDYTAPLHAANLLNQYSTDKKIKILDDKIINNIPIVSEIEFASWFTKYPIIAITGSNGKSTTVRIIKDIFSKYSFLIFCNDSSKSFEFCQFEFSTDIGSKSNSPAP